MNAHIVILLSLLAIFAYCILSDMEKRRKEAEQERRLRALQLADVDNMEGLDFEQYVCRLLAHRGFSANATRASHDYGVDIVAQRDGRKYAIQVKRHRNSVSRRAVSDAVAGRQHYGCHRAVVVTNSYFTRGAIELASSTGCELIDRDSLAQWILDYQGETDGERPAAENRDVQEQVARCHS